jgi:hypothetical protein
MSGLVSAAYKLMDDVETLEPYADRSPSRGCAIKPPQPLEQSTGRGRVEGVRRLGLGPTVRVRSPMNELKVFRARACARGVES